jgi:type VII secretion protein EccB
MKSRKDQVQAYFFVVGRLAAAVTHGKPDVLESPTKRMTTGTVLGFVLAAVIMGVFGIIGMFAPPSGDSSWRAEGAIVMDKTSGARYVYLGGQLRPVLNYSSARLVAGTGTLTSVAPGSLAGTTIGQPIGIPGAPDSLPEQGKVNVGPWTVCTQPPETAAGKAAVTLLLGLPAGNELTDGQALIVSEPGGKAYLLAQGKRFWVPGRPVLAALGYGTVSPVPVAASWLNTIPQGADLSAPVIRGVGDPGPVIDGRQSLVGQIFQVRNTAINTEQIYVVRKDGLAVLSRTGAALLLAAPSTQQAYPGAPVESIQVGPGALTGLLITASAGLANDLPSVPPEIVTPPAGTQPCLRHDPARSGEMGPVTELLPGNQVVGTSVPLGAHPAGTMVDRIAVPAGGGLLARNLPAPGAQAGAVYLITDVGTKYPLADPDAVTALGYTEAAAIPVSARLLNLLPTGPVLSTVAARQTQAVKP